MQVVVAVQQSAHGAQAQVVRAAQAAAVRHAAMVRKTPMVLLELQTLEAEVVEEVVVVVVPRPVFWAAPVALELLRFHTS